MPAALLLRANARCPLMMLRRHATLPAPPDADIAAMMPLRRC